MYTDKYKSTFLRTWASKLKAFRALIFLSNQVLGQKAAGNACLLIARVEERFIFLRGRRDRYKPCIHRFPLTILFFTY